MMKLITVKGNEQAQLKNLERVEANSHIHNDVDVSLSSSAPTSLSSRLIDEKSKVELVEKPLKDTSLTENASPTSKRNHKHKHHHHHNGKYHHHRHCPHHHHHHNSRYRVKTASQQPQSTVVASKAPNNEGRTVDTNASVSVSNGIDNETALMDDQQTPLVVHRDDNVQQSIITNDISQRVFRNQDQEIKSTKGNIPLQSIENKLVSQRVASADETQVGNFPSMICTQPASSIMNTCGVQQIERICYEDECCVPSSTINCASNSCIFQQSDPCVCCLPQQQPQLFLCTDPNSTQNYICSSSHGNLIQQTSVPQQQYICIDNTPSTIMNQISSSQPLLCVSQAPVQQPATIIIQQQPQVQAQPVQIMQAPQTQPGQYLQISSATPQVIQTIQAPGIQNLQPQIIQAQPFLQTIQAPAQSIAASPQILYQRPYDPITIPFQNQQFAVVQAPAIALSQPSYAPTRQTRPGPRMWQHALVRTVANRTGLPVPSPFTGGFQLVQPPTGNPFGRAPVGSTGSALLTGGLQPSASVPIVPLTAGGLLIPFQPSDPPKGTIRGALPRTGGYPSSLRNFNNTRQQIQQRAQLLADLQRQNYNQIPSLPIRTANAAVPPSPIFSSNVPMSSPGFSRSIPRLSSGFSPSVPQPSPAAIRSQTPYPNRNIFGTSSSSSSRSSVATTVPASYAEPTRSGLMYSQPSFGGQQRGSILSGPSALYQSARP